jgi:hypothetical protein
MGRRAWQQGIESKMAAANQSDFLGEGVVTTNPNLPKERATDPTGLYYLDTGEPTPLAIRRDQMARGELTGDFKEQARAMDQRLTFGPGDPGWTGQEQYDAKSGLYYVGGKNGGPRFHITNDPASKQRSMETPMFSVNGSIGTSDSRNMTPLAPGDGSIPGRQGTQAEANRANAYYTATGNSTPPGGHGAAGTGAGDLGAMAAQSAQRFDALQRERGTQAQDMFAQGAGAQDRTAASTGYINYGPSQSVAASNAGNVNYGPSQRVSAPTLAQAQQAAMGNFGAEQRVSAANVGSAAQATAQQAQSQARDIADLDFALSNESRGAMGESINRIRSYVDQGPGESQAQAQLRMAQEQNLGDALSLARSGRGNAAGNMKMALSENAATNAQTNMQASLLRANEADLWRGRQLQGLGLEQQGTTAMRGQDITAATAQGQHAVSREQIASNVDVANAQLGTQVSLGNAEQQNMGTRLQAQLSTDASLQQAALANARNVAMGQAGTQVGISNSEQANQTSRLQGQLQSDAAIQQAALANQLAIAQGDSSTQIGVTNANNQSTASRAQAELANQLAIAQGNSSTDINRANLDADVRQREANDRLQSDMYGYGVDLGSQQINAANYGAANAYDYANLGAEIDWRNLDRAAQVKTAERDRKQKQEAAYISALAASLASIV